MQKLDSKIRYFLYARKSQDREDRQMQSIPDQINVMKKIAQERNLHIDEMFKESKSAKTPNKRLVFSDMIKRIEKNEANGILCWKLNRLSRNPKENGVIQQLLQDEKIKSIVTNEKEHLSGDNSLIFGVESSMAVQYSRDLSKDVTRGMIEKVRRGGWPLPAPIGYLNLIEKDDKRIIIRDPERFSIVRRMWDMLLSEAYTPVEILRIASEQLGLRTIKRKKIGGGKLCRSAVYKLFTNQFYAGVLTYKGNKYQGGHIPMVSLDEFDRAQQILGKRGRPRAKTHQFAFTGVIRCAECGCMVTASEKDKFLNSTGEKKNYKYYHCSKRRQDYRCRQKPITLPDLESQIEKEIKRVKILPEFQKIALMYLNETNDVEIKDRTQTYQNQQKTMNKTQGYLDNLTQMRYRNMIDDDEYVQGKTKLKKEIKDIRLALQHTEQRAEDTQELTERSFNFITYAVANFNNGDLKAKKEILASIGVEFLLKDKRLEIQLIDWLQPIANGYKPLELRFNALEPSLKSRFTDIKYTKSELLNSLRSEWWT